MPQNPNPCHWPGFWFCASQLTPSALMVSIKTSSRMTLWGPVSSGPGVPPRIGSAYYLSLLTIKSLGGPWISELHETALIQIQSWPCWATSCSSGFNKGTIPPKDILNWAFTSNLVAAIDSDIWFLLVRLFILHRWNIPLRLWAWRRSLSSFDLDIHRIQFHFGFW